MAFYWKYSFYDSEYVNDEQWQKRTLTIEWLPMIVQDPLPFVAALWARIAEIGVANVFLTMVFVAELLFQELNDRANDINLDESRANRSDKLEDWRHHFDLVCTFLENINSCFGPVLLIQTALGFALPIFECNKMFYTKWQKPRIYFEYGHSIIRFLLILLIPSCAVTKQVCSLYPHILGA